MKTKADFTDIELPNLAPTVEFTVRLTYLCGEYG
jgi:hypothetical protein